MSAGAAPGAGTAAERAARDSRARLVALLARSTGDLAGAEDALADAFARALEVWPRDGVPAAPEAWLLTVARRRHLDDLRKRRVADRAGPGLRLLTEELAALGDGRSDMSDRRLELLYVCAHPSIDGWIRAPLMLQAVLGLDAASIARCWAVPAATMAQRLVRAKAKIREARIPFAAPEPQDRAKRLEDVLRAIYATMSIASSSGDLRAEAEYLTALILAENRQSPAAAGLHALSLYRTAITPADNDAAFVPLEDRNTEGWDLERIGRADALLVAAARFGAAERYQLEAAIMSAHLTAQLDGRDTRGAVVMLYRRLLCVAPSLGAAVGLAAALLRNDDPTGARDALDAAARQAGGAEALHQPYWATRGAVLFALGDGSGAAAACDRAIALTTDDRVATFLKRRRGAC